MVARAAAAQEAAEGTPGKEMANRLNGQPQSDWLKQLTGEKPAKKGSLGWPRRDINSIITGALQGPEWPMPPDAHAPKAAKPPVIDGVLDDPAWAKALTYEGMYPFNTKDYVASPKTVWKVTWDDSHLYIAWDCEDKDLSDPVRERDGAVWADDCVEVFILPDMRFRAYWELVIGPSGSIYDSIQCKEWDKWGCNQRTAENIAGLKVGITLRGTLNQHDDVDEGYTVEVAVPFSELPGYSRAQPKVGDNLHFMLVRLDTTAGKMIPYAYQPLLSWGHNIWNHARLILAE